MMDFTNRHIVITGGAGGIGVATARAFLEYGAHVILLDLDEQRLNDARTALGGVRVFTVATDLATPAICADLLERAPCSLVFVASEPPAVAPTTAS